MNDYSKLGKEIEIESRNNEDVLDNTSNFSLDVEDYITEYNDIAKDIAVNKEALQKRKKDRIYIALTSLVFVSIIIEMVDAEYNYNGTNIIAIVAMLFTYYINNFALTPMGTTLFNFLFDSGTIKGEIEIDEAKINQITNEYENNFNEKFNYKKCLNTLRNNAYRTQVGFTHENTTSFNEASNMDSAINSDEEQIKEPQTLNNILTIQENYEQKLVDYNVFSKKFNAVKKNLDSEKVKMHMIDIFNLLLSTGCTIVFCPIPKYSIGFIIGFPIGATIVSHIYCHWNFTNIEELQREMFRLINECNSRNEELDKLKSDALLFGLEYYESINKLEEKKQNNRLGYIKK